MSAYGFPYPPAGPRSEVARIIAAVFPDEPPPVDGGACKCKRIDKQAFERFEAEHGDVGMRHARRAYGLSFLEADWAVTQRSVFYVSPGPGFIWYRTWDQIDDIASAKKRRRFSTIVISDVEGQRWELHMGAAAADNFLAATQAFWRSRPSDSTHTGLAARGTYVPLLLVEQDRGGPGELRASSETVRFVTDRGVVHSYGWQWYDRYDLDAVSGEVTLRSNPGDGAYIMFTPEDPSAWTNLFMAQGLRQEKP